jgi:hypothetical protein
MYYFQPVFVNKATGSTKDWKAGSSEVKSQRQEKQAAVSPVFSSLMRLFNYFPFA